MEKYVVNGGRPLMGEVTISGAKNAAVAIIPAAILAQGVCIVENLPDISDVSVSLNILRDMGVDIKTLGATTYRIDATRIVNPTVAYEWARMMRASYYYLGALLGRFSRASVSMPGGCDIGLRPIDQHIKAFEALGAKVSIDHGMITVEAEELVGAHIYFDTETVGATVNAMLAAVRATGMTVLENAAKEPHIVDLANFLNSMGADIRGAGTDVIKIVGVREMHGSNYCIIPDQIEAGTFMVAAAATGGDVLVKNVIPKHLECITERLLRAGVQVAEYDDAVLVTRTGELSKINMKTMPYPGFPTDMQSQMTTLLAIANGTSIVTETIFDNRFRYVDELRRMGANIQVDGRIAVVEGIDEFTCARVKATDLRAGAALLIAAMCAKGRSEIEDIYHIERGYENLVQKLVALGADIKKVVEQDNIFAQAR